MNRAFASRTSMCLFAALAACSSSSTTTTTIPDAGHIADAAKEAASEAGKKKDAAPDGGGTITIASARQALPTTPITVKGYVTALAGVPGDYPQWYIEDPEGGEFSGVDVYCDPLAGTKCAVPEPALHDVILLTGTLTTYMGQVELEPTAMTLVQHDGTPPPVPSVTAADIAPKSAAPSPYRGVYVKLTIPSQLVVDSVTPTALADTACGATLGADAGADAGPPACNSLCEPPVYSGFQANDGAGNEVYIEAPFFHTDPLQSSPECLTQAGVVAVKVGTAFTAMEGILDVDPYSGSQALSPVLTTDYAIAK